MKIHLTEASEGNEARSGFAPLPSVRKVPPDFKVARLALRGAAGRSATRPTQFGHCLISRRIDRIPVLH